MKLKAFTQEETQQLIADLNAYWLLCGEISNIAQRLVQEAYDNHVSTFKWSWKRPFTKKVKSLRSMTFKICGGQFRDVTHEFIKSKGFSTKLSCWFGDSDPEYAFSKEHQNVLLEVAAKVGWWKHAYIADFQELLEKYAEHPVIPDASDIEIINEVRSRLKTLTQHMDEYNNAIHSN